MDVRASDQDREQTVAILRENWRAGRLTLPELEARCEEALGARMVSGLWHAVRELPVAPAPPPPPARPVPGAGNAVAGLVLSIVGGCLLVISFGLLSVVTVPMSATGWALGRQSRRRGAAGGHHSVAVAAEVLGLLGALLGVLAIGGCALIVLSVTGGRAG